MHYFYFSRIDCNRKHVGSDGMRIVVMRPPKLLAPIFRKVFGIKKEGA